MFLNFGSYTHNQLVRKSKLNQIYLYSKFSFVSGKNCDLKFIHNI